VTAHYDAVHALCRRMLGNDADALDATQDALVAAIRSLSRFDGRSSFGTWLYRVATNTCIDELRRRRRRPVTGIVYDIAEVAEGMSSEGRLSGPRIAGRSAPGPDPSGHVGGSRDPAEVVAARMDVDAALALLPVEFRTAVVLRDVCDLPYDEIAQVLDLPIGTVRSRIARARSALAATWKPEVRSTPDQARDGAGNRTPSPDVRTSESDRARATDASGAVQRLGRRPRPITDQPHQEERTQ